MKLFLAYLRSVAITFVSCLAVIWATQLLTIHAFNAAVPNVFALAAALGAMAWVLYIPIASLIMWMMNMKNPGVLGFVIFGTIAGTVAVWIAGAVAPSIVLLGLSYSAVGYAFTVCVVYCALAFASGSTRKNMKFMPTF